MALLLAGFLVLFGLLLRFTSGLGTPLEELGEQVNSLQAAGFLAGMLVIQFLLSRYATGMARYGPWSYLRAGGGYSLGTAIATGLAAITQLLLHAGQS